MKMKLVDGNRQNQRAVFIACTSNKNSRERSTKAKIYAKPYMNFAKALNGTFKTLNGQKLSFLRGYIYENDERKLS